MMYELLLFAANMTRVTSFDWQCQTVDKAKISDHQRIDIAKEACDANPSGAFVQGGTYRVNRSAPPVTPPTLGSAVISWTLPTTNTDGTPIGTITSFDLEYSQSQTNFVQAVSIPSGTSYTVPGLAAGTWYFRMRVRTAAGISEYTNLASKTIT